MDLSALETFENGGHFKGGTAKSVFRITTEQLNNAQGNLDVAPSPQKSPIER